MNRKIDRSRANLIKVFSNANSLVAIIYRDKPKNIFEMKYKNTFELRQ
jgi:hypothetical protein